MNSEEIFYLLIGMALGILVGLLIMHLLIDISLEKEVADELCENVTGNESAIAVKNQNKFVNQKLICEIPSFDSTQNIIVRSNAE